MSDLEVAVQNAMIVIDASARFENVVSEQLIIMVEIMNRQKVALSTMLDLFYINRMRLAKEGSLPQLLDLLKVSMQTHGQFQDVALEIAHALKRACEDVINEKTK